MTPTRIVLADDHLFFRSSFKRIIQDPQSAANGLKIVAEAANGKELIDCVEKFRPHIVITDIKMPVMNGIQATRIIKNKFPDTLIIALSEMEDAGAVTSMMMAGASSYLFKTSSCEEIIEMINKVREEGN